MIWLAVALCLLGSFIFSGIEAGILSVNRVRLKHQVKLRDAAAIKLEKLLLEPERLLVGVLVTTNLMNIFAITLVTEKLAGWLGTRGYWVALIVVLPVYLLLIELLSKSLFRRFPYRALAALITPLQIVDVLLAPLHFIGRGVVQAMSRRQPARQRKLFVAREEFKYLTIEGERTGTLSKTEREMIHNVVDFRTIKAREVMVPISKVHSIAADSSVAALLEEARRTNIDRWPVTASNGKIVGIVNVFDLLLDGPRRGRVETFQRRIVTVAPEELAFSVLRKLRAARGTLAAVIDPDGNAAGVVTWEDLIRRLVSTTAV
ncbi:MAG: hypothetical protein JWL90_1802 [Chthoniobacteraceae bacterium]|nr:hypothetical protein [Chthoniobacteraceae bacterium]